ncbi:MAG: tandem-95 repeat protein [Rhizobiaceae bacterium]
MAGSFQSIFRRKSASMPTPPTEDRLLMRVLEPRILLDAAAAETAADAAGQAAHSQFADDYIAAMANGGGGLASEDSQEHRADNSEAAETDLVIPRRTDREIVFIDSAVENADSLIASLEPGVSIHMLEAGSDGVLQIAEILDNSGGYDAIHIFSHGDVGFLRLGDSVLNEASIGGAHKSALESIGAALSETGDILIYGCNFGQGEVGARAANLLATATGADIAASDDLTGSESLSGDWDLEVSQGDVKAQGFTLPNWHGLLEGFDLQPTAGPTIGHLDNGVVGTANTIATWSDAVTRDPGGGQPLEYYDIRATLIGLSDGMSATFETAASTDGSMDDFRVVVTNIGDVVGSAGGQDIVEEGSVVVRWAIYEAGTDALASPDKLNLVFKDIEGLAGTPETRETVAVESEQIVSYTVNSGSDLQVGYGWDGLTASGTQQGVGTIGSDIGMSWASTNQFVVTYTSRTLITNFDMDGDRGMSVFPTPETTKTQLIDLNGSATGKDHTVVYTDGSILGSNADIPVSLVDEKMSIFDFDSDFLESATVTLTNPGAGDQINFDPLLFGALGLSGSLTNTGSELVLELSGSATVSNYETALQSLTYSNSNSAASFDRSYDRVIEFSIYDGVITSDISRTTVQHATADQAPLAGANVYVEDEDTAISAGIATGLLSNDSDPQNSLLTVIGATDSDSNPISIGTAHTMPSGALLTLNVNGSFTYIPPAHYSGNETISYTISDGTHSSVGNATFDIQPIIDDVTITVTQPDPLTDEDISSNPISVTTSSNDPSETQIVIASGIPQGVVITDGVYSFTTEDGIYDVEVTEWDRSQIRILPVQNSDEDVEITFITENFEIDGSYSFDSQTVTFEVDAVADVPILIVEQAFGDVDASVPLADTISVELFDTDGSEEITAITIDGIPVGAQMLIDSGPLPIVGGSVTFGLLDLPGLIFVPPVTGSDAVYNLTVSATASETNPENGVQQFSASQFGVGLRIELNDNDNPVVTVDDIASTFAGESVSIFVLDNDFIPDGAPLVTHIDGQPIDTANPVVLAGGQGQVELSPFGNLVFHASDTFAGEVKFGYTAQDADFSTDDGIVTVRVEPRWKLSSVPSVQEGNDARFVLAIEGGVAQGDSISVDLVLEDGTATPADHATLLDAISDSIANLGQDAFSFDGTTVTYNSPSTNYSTSYDPASASFIDISSTGDSLNLGNDGISSRSIGFEFDFYADEFSTVYISANGYLTFGSPGVSPDNASLDGSALSSRPAIAPFWDDLNTASGSVYVQTLGASEGQRQFVVQWEGVQNQSGANGTGSFQVVLNESNGSIAFNYRDVIFDGTGDNAAGATIGLQSSDGVADEFAFDAADAVSDGSSIAFSREANVDVELLIDVPIVDDPDFEDVEDFGLRISNSINSAIGTNNATVSIAVSDNAAPVANDDSLATLETGTGLINVITNLGGMDIDPEGHALQIAEVDGVVITGGTAVTLSSGATVGVNPNGSLNYNPTGAFAHLGEGELGTDTFNYRVVDSYGAVSPVVGMVTVNITGENQTAVIDLDDDGTTSATTNSIVYGPLETTMSVAAADAVVLDVDDTELTSLSIALGGFAQPGNEKLHVGALTIEYGSLLNSTVTVGGTVFRVNYDGANNILITNDGAAEVPIGDMEALIRTVSYENDSNDDTRGTRTLTFIATDDDGPGAQSVSEIYVVGNNVAPIAGEDGSPTPYEMVEDTSILITLADLLANDSDVDFNPLSIVAVDGGANGAAVLDGFGNVIYTPNPDFAGPTVFTYTLDDGDGGQDTGTVNVNVIPVNDAPRIDLNGLQPGIGNSITYIENDPATSMFLLTGTLTDVDNGTLAGAQVVLNNGQIDDVLSIGPLPAGITASIVPANAVTGLTSPATATIQFFGVASVADYEAVLRSVGFSNTSDLPATVDRVVTLTATDGIEASVVSTATISIQRINDLPDTNPDTGLSFDEDSSITVSPADLLANDSDADLETLTITSVQDPVNGTVITNGSGDFVFTADPDYFGPASFTYTVEDQSGGIVTETVYMTVNSVNDRPVVTLDASSGDGNYATTFVENGVGIPIVAPTISLADIDHSNLSGATVVLANGQVGDMLDYGTLPAGLTVSVLPVGAIASAGPITLTLNGSAPLADYEAALRAITYRSNSESPSIIDRSINVRVNDGMDDSNIGTTTVTVISVNDQPVANDDGSIAFDEDTTRIFTPAELLGNDLDVDGDTLEINSVQAAVNGNVVLNGDGTVSFTPDSNHFGLASFTYTIDDGNGLQSTATVNLTINSVNDLPQIDLDTGDGGSSFSTSYVENGPPIPVVDASALIQDVDDTTMAGATLVLTNGQTGDRLSIGTLPGGITASVSPPAALTAPGPMTINLSGAASLADYQTALSAVTYVSQSDNPTSVTRTVAISVNDGIDDSVVANTQIFVTAVNDAPTANDDGTYIIIEDTNLVLSQSDLLANDSDPENDALTLVSVENPFNGSVSLSGGTITFVPDPNYNGPASFEYTLRDSYGETATATVAVMVTAANDAPTADLDGSTPGSGHTVNFVENAAAVQLVDASVALADVDNAQLTSATFTLTNGYDGDQLEVGPLPAGLTSSVVPATPLTGVGTITVTVSGAASLADYELALQAVTYRSVSDRVAPDDRLVSLVVSDGTDDSTPVNSTVTITVINDAPIAGADGPFSTSEDVDLVLSQSDLLSNDTDADGDSMVIESVQSAVNGTVALDPSGNVVFSPDPAYFGPASFTYTVRDSFGATGTALVNLNVLIENDAPMIDLSSGTGGTGYSASYTENGPPVTLVDSDVSISDEDHAVLQSAQIVLTNGQAGDLLEVAGLPSAISATVTPSAALTTSGTITVLLTGNATLAEYQTAFAALSFRSVSQDPDPAQRVVEFSVLDGLDSSAVALTTIDVYPINDAPVAVDDGTSLPVSVTEDMPLVFDPVAANDFDFEGDSLFITEIEGIAILPGGTVSLGIGDISLGFDGTTLTYTPGNDFFGGASFAYTLSDGSLTDTATVNMEVSPVNDEPVAFDDGPVLLVEDGDVFFNPVSNNDSDVEGDSLTIISLNGTAISTGASVTVTNGTVTLLADGQTLHYIPNPDFNGFENLSYQVSDGLASATANVTFDVSPVDDAIVVVAAPPDLAKSDGDTVNIPMAGFFSDPDGDALRYSATGLPAGLVIDPNSGVISGRLNSSASQSAPYSVVVSAADGASSSASASFSIDVFNIVPTAAVDATLTVREGDTVNLDLSSYFVDDDNDRLIYKATGLPGWLSFDTAMGIANGTVPSNAALSGPVIVSVSADDGEGGTASLDVTIDPQNVAPVATRSIDTIQIQENDPVDIDISGLFVDGGSDTDSVTLTVSGLPDGLTYDSATLRISGTASAGSGSAAPYSVQIQADDGQGGLTISTFAITIGGNGTSSEQQFNFGGVEVESVDEVEQPEEGSEDPLSDVIDQIAELNGILGLDSDSAIILSTLSDIDPLNEAAPGGSDGGVSDQVSDLGDMVTSSGWIGELGQKDAKDWSVAGTFGYLALTEDGPEQRSSDERISVEISNDEDSLFINIDGKFDPVIDGTVAKIVYSNGSGDALPEWMKILEDGQLSATPPEDVEEFMLEMSVVMDTGETITKRVLIDALSGSAIDLPLNDIAADPDSFTFDEDAVLDSPTGLELDNLRGSIDTLGSQG